MTKRCEHTDQAISTGLHVDDIGAIHASTVPMLKQEAISRGVVVRSDTRKPQLIHRMLHSIVLEKRRTGRIPVV